MKNKLLLVALIAVILTVGMVFVSCGNKNCPGDGKCEITGSNPLGTGSCFWDFSLDVSLDECMPGTAMKCEC